MSSAETDWSPPERFDDYAIVAPLGRGGMGRVWLGRDLPLERDVALKFISSAEPRPGEHERLLVEARAIARLQHPNVVSIYRVGHADGRPYIAYEFVSGRTLDRLRATLAWQVVLTIGLGLARGLEAVHRAGLVHRDVKPANVILSDAGEVKLLDFGLAKGLGGTARRAPRATATAAVTHGDAGADLTRTGNLVGTPAYLAPELWRGEEASTRSDVFASGLVLHELLTGASTVTGRARLSREELARLVTTEDMSPVRSLRADVPESLAALVDRCLRRHPDDRPTSALELRAELEAIHSVFVPRTPELVIESLGEDAIVVASSFGRITPRLSAFTGRLYDRLFVVAPHLRPLFPDRLGEQRSKLAHAIKLTVDGLATPDRLAPALVDLGRRHLGYGVEAEDLALLGHVLLDTLREFDADGWTDETETSWRRAWAFMHDSMRRGWDLAASTCGSGVADQT